MLLIRSVLTAPPTSDSVSVHGPKTVNIGQAERARAKLSGQRLAGMPA